VDREQRQRIADATCEKWHASEGDVESTAIYERLSGWAERPAHDEFLEFIRELKGANLISGVVYLGNSRITDVNPDLCEEPLNY
jgi:hypothetical protein